MVLEWGRKSPANQSAADRELEFSKVGRKARMEGRAETVVETPQVKARPAWLERAGAALRPETYETAKLRFPEYDIYHVESEWRTWSEGKEPPHEPDKAFLAFFRIYVERNPI